MEIVNNPIIGNVSNNKLTNKNTSGFTYMSGLHGNDTYIVNNISNTWSDIDDLMLFDNFGEYDDGDFYFDTRGGNDTLIIKGKIGSELTFLFDVVKDGVNEEIADGLCIVEKSNIGSCLAQAKFYHDYNVLPQSGEIDIPGFFGNVLYGGSDWGSNHIETIKTSASNGATYTYDLTSYIYNVTTQVKSFLNTVNYSSAYSVLYYGDYDTLGQLASIYYITPISMKITGSNKSDKLYGDNAYDNINGKSGNDKIYAYGGHDLIKGGDGKDTIDGGYGDDRIYGQNGNDKLYGRDGNDKIWGGKGNNKIYGDAGNDVLKGDSGKDAIAGGSGNDKLYGYKGNDKLYGKSGNDKITGGKGNDTINAGSGNNKIYFAKKDGKDTIVSGGGTDTIIFTNEKFKNIKFSFSGDDLIIKYTGGQIKLKDYNDGGHSAQYIKIGDTQKSIENLVYGESSAPVARSMQVNSIKSDVAGWLNSGAKGYSNDIAMTDSSNVQDNMIAMMNSSNFSQQEIQFV